MCIRDRYISVNAAWNLSRNVKHISNVEEIYKECDYITVHVPLLDSTKGMIDKNAIDMMKDGVVILNFARDLLVDEAAVVAALADKKAVSYTHLDVYKRQMEISFRQFPGKYGRKIARK